MSAVENVYDYFEDHAKAAAYVKEFRPVIFGTLCLALGGATWYLANAMAQRLLILSFGWSSLFLVLLWEIGTGFILASVVHLMMEIQGISGSASSLYVLLGMADLVWVVALPWILIAKLLLPNSHWPSAIVFFAVYMMSFGLKARSVRDNYKISAARAWFTLILPYFSLFVFLMLVFLLAAWISVAKLLAM